MRQLTIAESNLTAGGQQKLIITDQFVINSIPEICLENYYQANKNNMAAFVESSLANNLVKFCAETQDYLPKGKVELDFVSVTASIKD